MATQIPQGFPTVSFLAAIANDLPIRENGLHVGWVDSRTKARIEKGSYPDPGHTPRMCTTYSLYFARSPEHEHLVLVADMEVRAYMTIDPDGDLVELWGSSLLAHRLKDGYALVGLSLLPKDHGKLVELEDQGAYNR